MPNKTPKPKKKRSRSKKDKELQTEKIIEGSLELIREKGFHGFGMRALANHIGMSQGNLYNYMASQRELWIAVRIRCMHDFKKRIEEIAFSSEKSTVETLIDIGEFVLDYAAEDLNRWKLSIGAVNPPEAPKDKDGNFIEGKYEKKYKTIQVLDVVFDFLRDAHYKKKIKAKNYRLVGFYLYSIILGITMTEQDLSVDENIREPIVHDDLYFDKNELRKLAYSQIADLLNKE